MEDAEEALAALLRFEVNIIGKRSIDVFLDLGGRNVRRDALDAKNRLVAVHVLLVGLVDARDAHPNLKRFI